VPYFERPKAPHDWRWTVGLIGRILIVTGLLMFAFVAYQLWGTGIQTARAQNDLDTQFQELLQSTSTSTSTTSTTAPTETTDGTTTTSTIPVAPAQVIAAGTPVAQLHIDRIGLSWTVVEGVGTDDLRKGPGHFPETPMPGQLGNAAIAGHRTTYGAPFYDLDELQPGDLIEVDTLAGRFVYSVTGSTVVNPSEYAAVIPTVDPNTATLTLATCTPIGTARQRLIVKAVLVPDQSSAVVRPPSATTPLDATTTTVQGTLPGDDTTVPPTDGTVQSSTTSTTIVPALDSTTGDSFSGGWFDDTSAILPTILWGLVLAGVAVGSWFIGKRANRLWVCYAVGAVPFVVVLYFFFENINRLLPPGI
jgi:sortase A